jgi:hypothetical protein
MATHQTAPGNIPQRNSPPAPVAMPLPNPLSAAPVANAVAVPVPGPIAGDQEEAKLQTAILEA